MIFRRRGRKTSELDEEIEFHLSEEADERTAAGHSADEARFAAKRDFGNATLIREAMGEAWSSGSFERLGQDVRQALRTMRRHPGFSALVVLTLAIGIGANTAIFSLVSAILLRPLPYRDASRLVSVTGSYPKGAFIEMRRQTQTMSVAAYADGHEFTLSGIGKPVRLTATVVSAELLSVLGARPEMGRTFEPGEDMAGRDTGVILGHAVWEQVFARDPAIIGRSITLDGNAREVLGVMPADFQFPSAKTQIWLPLAADPRNPATYWAGDFMPVIGRLHPGATLEQARDDVRRFQSQVTALFPWKMPPSWNANVSVVPLQTAVAGDSRPRLFMLLGVVAVVLLIACANIANLLLARAAFRARELGVRFALGAGYARIARQLLTESIVLALSGGALGLAFAVQGLALLKRILPPDTPRLADAHLDWHVLSFTACLALVTGLMFGLAPSLHATRATLMGSLKTGGRGASLSVSRRLRSALVVAEIGFAVLVVIAAGLLGRSLWALSHVNTGFHAEHVVTARITPNQGFCSPEARCLALYRQVVDQMHASPGVSSAALVNTLPLDQRVAKRSLNLEGRNIPGGTAPLFWLNVITPEYLRVMGIPLVRGRAFTDADLSGNPPVAIVPRATARKFWTEESAIGKRFRFVGEEHWHTVVGVVGDVRAHDLRQDVPGWLDGAVYVPYSPKATLEDAQIPTAMTIAAISSTDSWQFDASLRKVLAGLSMEVPVTDVRPMHGTVSEAVASPASLTTLFAAFAGVALVLAVVGIYGVLSFLVSKRTREIAIRVALGAQSRDVFSLIMKEGAQLALAGIGLGMAAAAVVTRVLSSELYGIGPTDPVTYGAVAIVMMIVTTAACCVPTYRATRVNPLIALRLE